jgi:osmotically-inducible protein OsmY
MGYFAGMPSVEQIKAEVLREIRQDPRLKGSNIGVNVRDATVTLTGAVASAAEVSAAVEAANRAESLFYLVNHLIVAKHEFRSPPSHQLRA